MSYTIDQLCKRWQVGRNSIYRLFNEGKLKRIKIGRLVRVMEEEVKRFEGEILDGQNEISGNSQ